MSAFAIDLMNAGIEPIHRPADGRWCKSPNCTRSLEGREPNVKYCQQCAISRKMLRNIEQGRSDREKRKARNVAQMDTI